ncbi:tRNA (N6-threonylcarbamoyladenosine(37)-N6)-methyltransferase TrmO [Marinimicrobium alkaliphilum]|uniref:tRNA (N6-threonylcarbamoyladenosine(37)-N6)-methyltransferase TrmO n=1 Tax=Marinimicrobium alkaliphilum TaxID=2202654 RepID=UPI000DBAA8F7|nr:tRNA (N6-threonylcarbamoyladenosine(37)-N6)-methyltransferase TrmO [Marinimicrobium alkaliphilum]
MAHTFDTIAIAHTGFKEKFGIPRQPGLAPAARGQLEILPPYDQPEAFDGLEQCSHLWLQFVFHRASSDQWRPRVRPPRLGGQKSLGVFATRAPVRPNPIGLSVVRYEGLHRREGKLWLDVSGVDLLDGTPILDIKPYVPYVDALTAAENRVASAPPTQLPIRFTPASVQACADYHTDTGIDLHALIAQVLAQDPRPRYQAPDPERRYGMRLYDRDVHWHYRQAASEQDTTWEIEVVDLVVPKDSR